MDRAIKRQETCLSAKAATGWGTTVNVQDFKHVLLQFGTASSANMTVKFAASAAVEAPDFTASQSVANHWDYVGVIDLQSGSVIAGDTGIALTGTDDFRTLMVNIDGINWINCHVSAYSAGSVTTKVSGYTNA